MISRANSQGTRGARLLLPCSHMGRRKDNDDNYGEDVEVMLL